LRVALPLAACLAIAVMLNTTVVPQLFSGITGGETPLAASDQSSSARSLASEAALPSAQDVQQVVPDSQENLAATDAQDAAGTAEASAAANADAPTLSQSTASAYDATTAAPTEGDTLLWALLTALVTLPVLLLAAALIFLLFRR
jgi:hypothetical protein